MSDFIEKNRHYILLAIGIVAVILIFGGLLRADIQTDDATYSLRALGYFDFMDSQQQTTPILWFNHIPFWSRLSFHDAPPLVFIIQFLFFKIFGISTLTARLPFALAGLGCVLILYVIVKKLFNTQTALLSSGILAISSYHIWASQVGYLEIVSLFFILLTVYVFQRVLDGTGQPLGFGLCLGLMLLTKYTTFFVLPALGLYLLLYRRDLLRNKNFLISLGVAGVLILPVVYFNIKMYQARGHFDVQFAKLLGQNMSDWQSLVNSGTGPKLIDRILGLWRQLASTYSLPAYVVAIASLCYFIVTAIRKRQHTGRMLIALLIIFLVIQFTIIGSTVRFDSIIDPFLAVAIGVAISELILFSQSMRRVPLRRPVLLSIIAVGLFVAVFELFYNINTNLLYQPIGPSGITYSVTRWPSGGFNQLENYLKKNETVVINPSKPINSISDLIVNFNSLPSPYIFVYDHNLNWFSTLWYFRRWTIYGGSVFVSNNDLAMNLQGINWFDYFQARGVKAIYFIRGENQDVLGASYGDSKKQELNEKLERIFISVGAVETSVYNNANQLAFKIYKLTLN